MTINIKLEKSIICVIVIHVLYFAKSISEYRPQILEHLFLRNMFSTIFNVHRPNHIISVHINAVCIYYNCLKILEMKHYYYHCHQIGVGHLVIMMEQDSQG